MSLSTRNQFADFLSAQSRRLNSEIWDPIESSRKHSLAALQKLSSNGFISLTLSHQASIVSELLSHSPSQFLDPNFISDREIVHLTGLSGLPSIYKLVNDISLYKFVSLYLGAPARILDFLAWWHFPMPPGYVPSNVQRWHRDRDDFAELKLFFYATDVNINSGPHAFLPGSHLSSSLANLFPTASIENPIVNGQNHTFLETSSLYQLGLSDNSIHKFLGPPGTCFLEDTRGFHRAFTPLTSSRLIFSVVWTVASGKLPFKNVPFI